MGQIRFVPQKVSISRRFLGWSPPLPVTSCPMQRCLHGRCQLFAFLVRRSVRSGPHAVRTAYSVSTVD